MKNLSKLFCKAAACAVLITLTASCVTNNNMYQWGGYSNNLLSYYKDPAQLENFSRDLYKGIEKAEIKDAVPPGMYAEYGYTMLELNDAQTASVYFQKEWEKWPESRFLMDKVMNRLISTKPENAEALNDNNKTEGAM